MTIGATKRQTCHSGGNLLDLSGLTIGFYGLMEFWSLGGKGFFK